MRKEFSFERFLNEKIAIHCSTKEESKDFTERCCEKRFTWGSTELPDWNYWKEQTCYSSKKDKKIYCTNIDFYKERGYPILEWNDYMEKEFTIDDLKSGYMVELANGKKCLVERWNGLRLCDSEFTDVVVAEGNIEFANPSQRNNWYAISKVYGYREKGLWGILWECKKPKPITLKCETENYSIVKNDENTIIESKKDKVSVLIPNDDIKELLPMVQKLFRKPTIDDTALFRTRDTNKFKIGDTVMVDGQNDCRGERGIVLNCTDKYVTVFLTSTYIADFSPKVLTRINNYK